MSMHIPPAMQRDLSGAYHTAENNTSGGDIGAMVPIFPVIWVRHKLLECYAIAPVPQRSRGFVLRR